MNIFIVNFLQYVLIYFLILLSGCKHNKEKNKKSEIQTREKNKSFKHNEIGTSLKQLQLKNKEISRNFFFREKKNTIKKTSIKPSNINYLKNKNKKQNNSYSACIKKNTSKYLSVKNSRQKVLNNTKSKLQYNAIIDISKVNLSTEKGFLLNFENFLHKFILHNEILIKQKLHKFKIKNNEIKKNYNKKNQKTIYDYFILFLKLILTNQKKIFFKYHKKNLKQITFDSIYGIINIVRILNMIDFKLRACLAWSNSLNIKKEDFDIIKQLINEIKDYSNSSKKYLNQNNKKIINKFIDEELMLHAKFFVNKVKELNTTFAFEGCREYHIGLNHLSLEYILRWYIKFTKKKDYEKKIQYTLSEYYDQTYKKYKKFIFEKKLEINQK